MCNLNAKISTTLRQPEKKFSLASFFHAHWDNYLASPKYPVSMEQRKAVSALMKCRTAALGKDVYKCDDCGREHEVYFSCKHRFCPTCSWSDTQSWASVLHGQLLNVPHRHVVMTLPHLLHSLIRKNSKFFYETLMRESSNMLKDYMKKRYKVDIGVVCVLHTYGERKNFHVHVHMIVSWGGIDKSKSSLKSIPIADRIDYMKLKEGFRSRILHCMDKAYLSGDLRHDFESTEAYEAFKVGLLEKPWILHLEPPMSIPEQVIRYIGRYSKRACLSEYKITDISGEYISFRYKDYKEKQQDGKYAEKVACMHYNDFFPMLLQHVPIAHFRIVRYYGVYATRTKIPAQYREKPSYTESNVIHPFVDPSQVCIACSGAMQHVRVDIRQGSILWFINQRRSRRRFQDQQVA